jgi:hypothetical protein
MFVLFFNANGAAVAVCARNSPTLVGHFSVGNRVSKERREWNASGPGAVVSSLVLLVWPLSPLVCAATTIEPEPQILIVARRCQTLAALRGCAGNVRGPHRRARSRQAKMARK